MRKEVISHKEAHEDPIVNAPLNIKRERQAGHGELSFQILQPKGTLPLKLSKGTALGVPAATTTDRYLTQNIQPKEDELSFCTWKAIRKFIMLQERKWRVN